MKRSLKASTITLALALLLTGCGSEAPQRAPEYESGEDSPQNKFGFQEATNGSAPAASSAERMSTADISAPGISPAAAPGVAFRYGYSFVLPDRIIAGVQEQHASACEKLGPARCRITGMRYTLVDEDHVEAYLQFKLAPELARQFGKDGIAAVEKAEGKLVDAVIEGNDAGAAISASRQRSVSVGSDLESIEKRLAEKGLKDEERAELERQAGTLRQQLNAEKQVRADNEEQLANTPMTFNYAGSKDFTLGRDPLGDSARGAWASLTAMITSVLMVLGYALPWVLLAAVLIALWRSRLGRAIRRWIKGDSGQTESNLSPVPEALPAGE